MSEPVYSKKTNKRGRLVFYKDHRMVAERDIPDGTAVIDRDFELEETLVTIDEPAPVDDTVVENPKGCIFCNSYATKSRFINMTTISLCENCYLGKTLGEVAQALRKKEASG